MNVTRTATGTKTISKRKSIARRGGVVALTLFFLGTVIIAGGSTASAARIDCIFASCGFGGVAPVLGNPIPTQTLIAPSSFTGTLDETVYVNGNTYTYLFTTKNLGPNAIGALATSTLPSAVVGPTIKSFMNGTLNFGIVTTGGPAGSSTPGYEGANTTFQFLPGSLQATNFQKGGSPTGLVGGDALAWYAQAKLGPAPGVTTYLDGISSSGASLDPAPEPSTALLLALGFPMLSGLVARRRRGRSKASAAIPA